jgi:hypothetical protein
MSAYKYKIGDFVKIIKAKHVYFGTISRVLKINKSVLVITSEDGDNITISKKYVEIYNKPSTVMKMIPLSKGGRKKQGLDYYMKKAFSPEDFNDFVLFNFMRPFMYRPRRINGKFTKMTASKLLEKKVREKKVEGSNNIPCVFFTPIPVKFFKKYFSEKLIEHYSHDGYTSIFICLDSTVLCNMPKNYWIGFNSGWEYGPESLKEPIEDYNIFYALDSCDTKPKMDNSFLEFFMEQLARKLEMSYLHMLGNNIGLTIYLDESQEDKFINYIKEKGADLFLDMEIFACNSRWTDNEKATLRFKKEELLIANYEKNTVEENIKRVLGL